MTIYQTYTAYELHMTIYQTYTAYELRSLFVVFGLGQNHANLLDISISFFSSELMTSFNENCSPLLPIF